MTWYDEIVYGDITVRELLIFIFSLIIVYAVAKLAFYIVRKELSKRTSRNAAIQNARIFEYVIIGSGLYIATWEVLKMDFSAMLLSLSFLGVTIAFAIREFFANAVAGVIIALTKQVEVDDWVEISGIPETGMCIVREITVVNTVLEDLNKRTVYIPNGYLFRNKTINYSKRKAVAVELRLKVAVLEDLDRFAYIVYEEAEKYPYTMPDAKGKKFQKNRRLLGFNFFQSLTDEEVDKDNYDPQVEITAVDEDGVELLIRVWIRRAARSETTATDMYIALIKRLKAEGISLA